MYSNGRKHRSNTRQILHERVPDATLLTVVFFTTGGGTVIKSIGNILLRSLHHWSTSPAKYHWKKVFSNFQIINAINFLEENLARFWFSCLHKSYPIHNEHTVSPTPVKPRDTDISSSRTVCRVPYTFSNFNPLNTNIFYGPISVRINGVWLFLQTTKKRNPIMFTSPPDIGPLLTPTPSEFDLL